MTPTSGNLNGITGEPLDSKTRLSLEGVQISQLPEAKTYQGSDKKVPFAAFFVHVKNNLHFRKV